MARTSLHTDDGVHRLDNEENLEKINAFVQNFLADSTLYPKARLEQLRVRLNHIGLDFDCNKGVEMEEGTYTYPVEYFGRGYGYHPTTGEIGEFDYGEAKLGTPLQLEVYKEGDGTYNMSGRISFAGDEEEDDLVGEALELLLNIDNDEELFESKILPAFESVEEVDEEGLDRVFRGILYGVRSAAKKYEMDIDEETIEDVALYILEDVFSEEEDDEVEELDELKMPKRDASGRIKSDKVRAAYKKGAEKAFTKGLAHDKTANAKLSRGGDALNKAIANDDRKGVDAASSDIKSAETHHAKSARAFKRMNQRDKKSNESVELDELKSSTLRSYVTKRRGQVQSDLSTGKHSPSTNKKAKGVSAALSRLDARKQLKGAHPKSQRGQEWSGLARQNPKDKD